MTAAPNTVLYLDHTAKLSGGELALVRLLEAVDRSRVTPVALLAEDGPLTARLCAVGVETHVLPLTSAVRDLRKDSLGLGALRRVRGVFSLLSYSVRVARFARRRGVDILHTNSLKSDIYGALAGRLAALPVVWHVRDHIDPTYLPRPAVRLFRLLARKLPSYVVTNSQSTLDRLRGEGDPPSGTRKRGRSLHARVVHDGLSERELLGPPLRDDKIAWSRPVRIGLVGRITAWKGQHIFLEAAAQVSAAGHAARFRIVGAPLFGEEDYAAELQRKAEVLGIADRVEFLGFQKEVPAVLRNLDILVHASTTPEPFGQVVIEGMAEGLPVIGTDGGGVREIITHGENGLLVPMGDADALARALIGLIDDPARARRLGEAGYAHVRAHFTAAQSARKIEKVYQEIRNHRRRRGERRVENGTSALP